MSNHGNRTSFGDNLAELLGEAVGDVRRQLVEEAWFGRQLSAHDRPSYNELVTSLYGSRDEQPAIEHGHDRSVEIER